MTLNRRVNNQDVSYFLDLRRNGQLDLDPPFQRRSVWTRKDRIYFLDTVFRGYPSPSIYLSKDVRPTGEAVFSVVDGKQRLETIIMFSEDRIVLRDYGDTQLDGRKWSELRTNGEVSRRFLDYVLPVEQLTVGDNLNEVFDRLNRNNKNLNRQELRHAKYHGGWFLDFVEKEVEDPFWRDELGYVTPARARRMHDVQMLSELLIVVAIREVRGFDHDEIDQYTAKYDDSPSSDSEGEPSREDLAEAFHRAKQLLRDLVAYEQPIALHTKEARHLYSLWAFLCLSDNLPESSLLAKRYADFMHRVRELQKLNAPESPTNESSPESEYFSNSRGPNTELPQRRARHDCLVTALGD